MAGDANSAHVDSPDNPGVFTNANAGVFIGGKRVTPTNAQSLAAKGTITYDSELGELTLDNATIESAYTGIGEYRTDGLILKLIGTNVINAQGVAIYAGDLFIHSGAPGASLTINSVQDEGVNLDNAGTLSGSDYDNNGEFSVNISGVNGAIYGLGKDGCKLFVGNEMTLSLSNPDMYSRPSGDPIITNMSQIVDESALAFSYDYIFDEEMRTMLDYSVESYIDKKWCTTVVAKPFKIVRKDKLVQYPVNLGGHYLNNYNCDDFSPMSLKGGTASYDPSAHVLYLHGVMFNTSYTPYDDNYALYVKLNDFTLQLKGHNRLYGTNTTDYEYGIYFTEDDSDRTRKRQWKICNEPTFYNTPLEMTGSIYCWCSENDGELTFKDVEVKVKDEAHIWQEDNVSVTIDNSSLDLTNDKWDEMNIMEYIEGLTLTNCAFADGCYFDSKSGCVMNAAGQPATGRVRILRGGSGAKKGDVNNDGDVNTGDVTAVYKYITDGTSSGFSRDRANVNGDNEVNTADVTAIYNIIIGN